MTQEVNALVGAHDVALKCAPLDDEHMRMRFMLQVTSSFSFSFSSSSPPSSTYTTHFRNSKASTTPLILVHLTPAPKPTTLNPFSF